MGENDGERGGDEEEEEPMLLGRWTRPPYDPSRSLYSVRGLECVRRVLLVLYWVKFPHVWT